MKIVTNTKQLTKVSESVSKEEGEEIAVELFQTLKKHKGIGLSAPQIGIHKRVCIVHVKDPIVLINPVITKQSEKKFISQEGCLSLPHKVKNVLRSYEVTVSADNLEVPWSFGSETAEDNKDLLEAACVQHEIDHLDGILITSDCRKYNQPPIRAEKKIGRNEIIVIEKDSQIMSIKYKKLEEYLNNGWKVISNSNSIK